MIKITNDVEISGKVMNDISLSHEVYTEKFYIFTLEVMRLSGEADLVPVMVSERMNIDLNNLEGKPVKIHGNLRSFNDWSTGKSKLILSVFPRTIEIEERRKLIDNNSIELEGYICSKPRLRSTKRGKDICDITLAVYRPYKKVDYIPCISWGRNAIYCSEMSVGTKIVCKGRIQSREYFKKCEDSVYDWKITREVSINLIEKIEEK